MRRVSDSLNIQSNRPWLIQIIPTFFFSYHISNLFATLAIRSPTMAHFYHFNFHSSIGHHGPKRTPKQHSEKKAPKVTTPATPETASEILAQQTTKRILRCVDLRLVPILSLLYLLCFLCRQNIGNAKIFHMTYDLHLTTQQYQVALTAFFLSYSTFDIPCNIMLKKLRPSVWLPLVTLLSGAVTVCMGVVKNADELIVVRMFLGMTEVSSSSLSRVWIVLN